MKIYDDYLKTIENAINTDSKVIARSTDHFTGFAGAPTSVFNMAALNEAVPPKQLMPSLADLSKELGLVPNFDQQLGAHPHFKHLKGTDEIENHYIVSVFIDVKGSTNLFRKYTAETVLLINTTIQRVAIHTCLIFGGYVHRLQGDGLFVYFGGKDITKEDATLRALQSTSMFSYFMKNDLKRVFLDQGIDKIFTRIGIDLGDDADVIWSNAGIGEISEVTTCSLHTSLASKMQSSAESNGIVVGDNIKTNTDLKFQEFMTPVVARTKKDTDRYIFEIPDDNFRYTQYDLNWYRFLKGQGFILTSQDDELFLKRSKGQITEKNIENLKREASKSKPYLNGSKQ